MFKIEKIAAIEVLDSRGNPTVEARVILEGGYQGYGIAPSGASTGKREAVELRDHNESRYLGRGVSQAVYNVNQEIAAAVDDQFYATQQDFDEVLCELDGTPNKSKLGANAILACSLAFARACAAAHNMSLAWWLAEQQQAKLITMPTPMVNVLNGGMHADNRLYVQEFMIVPLRIGSFTEKVRMSVEVFHTLKQVLKDQKQYTNVGDEGGFAPQLRFTIDALNCVVDAIQRAGYKPGEDFGIALDVAANYFYRKGKYYYEEVKPAWDAEMMIKTYTNLIGNYPIVSLEDPIAEEDQLGWKQITAALGDQTMIVGDDLLVTNPRIIEEAAQQSMANAVIIKPNQIGTLTESWQAVMMARKYGYKVVISHRSGDSEDTAIAHLAAAWNAEYIKSGSMSRTDRVGKYNELMRLEQDFV